MKLNKIFMKIIWFLWGLPQNIIGGIMFMMLGDAGFSKYKDSYVVQAGYSGPGGAVSLGMFIFIFRDYGEQRAQLIKHEYGHSIQSKILGPFFLIFIGVPSFIWAAFFKSYRRKRNISYYDFYTERWADKLGKVKR